MFAKLQQASRLNDTGGFPYLRSHPLTTERMADMQARIPQPAATVDGNGNANSKGPAVARVLDHAMVAARARVLSHAAVDDLRSWAADAEPSALARQTTAQQAGVLYGASFAALKLRDFSTAQAQLARLETAVRQDRAAARLARLLGAELALAQGRGDRALALLQASQAATAQSDGVNRAELLLLAQAAVVGSQARPAQAGAESALVDATQNLQTWVAGHPRDAQAWQQLSTVYGAQGRTLGAIRAQAEVDMAQLNYPAALTRFKTAQDWARKGGAGSDHIEASIVDTRTREATLLVREQALER